MLEDREKKIVYVPFACELLPQFDEWSAPVQIKIERAGSEMQLVFRKVETKAERVIVNA